MKCKFEAEYRGFTGKWNLLIHILLFFVTCAICYLTSGMIWQLSVMICPILSMLALCFMDYFAFAGTNSKRAKGMELLKSSFYGGHVLKKALRQDVINKSVYHLLATAFTTIIILSSEHEKDFSATFALLYICSAFATGQLLMRLTLLITRNKGLTMQTHILITYFAFFIGSVLFIPLIFLSEMKSVLFMSLYFAAAEALSILSGIWLLTSCYKAYDTTFSDTV